MLRWGSPCHPECFQLQVIEHPPCGNLKDKEMDRLIYYQGPEQCNTGCFSLAVKPHHLCSLSSANPFLTSASHPSVLQALAPQTLGPSKVQSRRGSDLFLVSCFKNLEIHFRVLLGSLSDISSSRIGPHTSSMFVAGFATALLISTGPTLSLGCTDNCEVKSRL